MNNVTFESVEAFVGKCLELAKAMPDLVTRFESQAFGATVFACDIVWQNDPKLERSLLEHWDNVWRPAFEGLY